MSTKAIRWRRLGHVFKPEMFEEFSTHAQVPTAVELSDFIRVFYGARNKQTGKSFITYVDLDSAHPTEVLRVNKNPIMPLGEPGTFDEDGVMPGYCYLDKNKVVMYYSGWNQKVTTPYHNATGLAVSNDNGESFERVFKGPVMDRTPNEPFIAVTPTILRINGKYQMWYISGLRWAKVDSKYEPVYVIKEASSVDGENWIRSGRQVVPSTFDDEAFSHPTAFFWQNRFHMYYCFRGSVDYRDGKNAYKLGYANSEDGVSWNRDDSRVEIFGQQGDWEKTMTCYPYFLECKSGKYLFYNGNSFGRTGFGIAKMEE